MLEAFLFYYLALSARVFTIPDNFELPDCKDEITFLAGECSNATISAISSFFDFNSDNVSRYSSPI